MDVDELLACQGGFARRRQLRKAGLSRRALKAAVAAGRLRLLTPDLYATTDPHPDDLLRCAVLRLGAVVSHQTAALLWGIELVTTPTQPHVTVGRNRGRADHPGVQVHRRTLDPDDRESCDGIAITTVLRTLFDLSRSLPLAEAVASVDSALRQQLVTLEELAEELRRLPAAPGRRRVARVLDLVDPSSGSVLESLCRVLMGEAGLPRPFTQYDVRHRGRWVGRVDFAWRDLRVIVETDGFAFHSDRASYRKDRRRHNALQLAGWQVLRFSWEDVVHDPAYVLTSLRELLTSDTARAAA